MMAAEFSSITKTKSVRTICASSSIDICGGRPSQGRLVRSYRLARAAVGGQRGAAPFGVGLALVPEMLQRRQHRRHGGVAERAECLAADVVRDAGEQIEVAHLPFAMLDA